MWAIVTIIVVVLVVDLCVIGIYKALQRTSSKNSSDYAVKTNRQGD